MLRTCLYTCLYAVLCSVAIVFARPDAIFAADPTIDGQSVQWQPGPPEFPPGAEFAVIAGDPASDGAYVVRTKLPPGYRIAAHTHPTSEYVTVLSGDFHVGMGDKLDPAKSLVLRSGGFVEAPAKMNHYGWTEGGTVLQVHGQGPFSITYVNLADDPRTAMK
jgi:quercetin dioxygenase-like cupin family protein